MGQLSCFLFFFFLSLVILALSSFWWIDERGRGLRGLGLRGGWIHTNHTADCVRDTRDGVAQNAGDGLGRAGDALVVVVHGDDDLLRGALIEPVTNI